VCPSDANNEWDEPFTLSPPLSCTGKSVPMNQYIILIHRDPGVIFVKTDISIGQAAEKRMNARSTSVKEFDLYA
jgi:hypothetical protein